jgi:hypothetical protein
MRRFSSIVAIALSTLLLVSICSAQQASTTGASATATVTVGGTSASAKDPTVLPPYTTGYIAPAFDQEDENAPLRGYYEVKPLEGVSNAMVRAESAAGTTIPLWTYNIRSTRDGNPYLGVMVGAKPALNSSTTIPTQIVPVIININGVVFDPTSTTCSSAGSAVTLTQQSPIFKPFNFVFGGTPVGNTQYTDAFQRANFWVQLTTPINYHTLLGLTTLGAITVNVPVGLGFIHGSGCGALGIMNGGWWDGYVKGTLIPLLRTQGVNPTTFPIFLFNNVVLYNGTPNNCCILGYHGAFGNPTQTYSTTDFDLTGLFGSTQDTATMAHEVAEWMDDPLGNNPTPSWGHTGQVSGCQDNLEVGDPLSGHNIPNVIMPNGYTYHLQELAFFWWFYGAPSMGVNG